MLAKRLDPSSFQDEDEDLPTETSKDRTAVLAIAYHNMGVEQEFLRSYPAAILSYKKAVNFAEKHLGPEDGISQNLRSVFENAKVEVSELLFLTLKLDNALYKKGGKAPRKNQNKGRKSDNSQYDHMLTPRQDNNDMEKVEEEDEGAGQVTEDLGMGENHEEAKQF